jgi:UPF0716 family protein affecting phage T7 exclusion
MRILGAVVFAAGLFIWLGNVLGFFPTIPMLGYLTMLGGGALARSGND